MMKITTDIMMKKDPCPEWPRERVAAYLGKGKTLTAMLRDALANNGISITDAMWGVTRFLPDKINRAFAIWCARQCKTDIKEITDYIDAIERYYSGSATKEELCAAGRAACWAAYRAADSTACWAAYRAADRAACRAADRSADSTADSTACWAAYSTACWAAYRAVRQSQAEKLIEMIEALETKKPGQVLDNFLASEGEEK